MDSTWLTHWAFSLMWFPRLAWLSFLEKLKYFMWYERRNIQHNFWFELTPTGTILDSQLLLLVRDDFRPCPSHYLAFAALNSSVFDIVGSVSLAESNTLFHMLGSLVNRSIRVDTAVSTMVTVMHGTDNSIVVEVLNRKHHVWKLSSMHVFSTARRPGLPLSPVCDVCRSMMTSWNEIFRVTGHLCGEFTGHRWIPRT